MRSANYGSPIRESGVKRLRDRTFYRNSSFHRIGFIESRKLLPLVAKKNERKRGREREMGETGQMLDYQVVTAASSHDNYWSKVVKWLSSVRSVFAIGPAGEKNHLLYFFLDTTDDGKRTALPSAEP